MSSIQSIILGLLDTSSLPGLFKNLVTNMLPNMSRIQQENILQTLLVEQKNAQVLDKKKMAIYRKYSPIVDSVLDSVENGKPEFPLMGLDILKKKTSQNVSESSNLKLDALKNIMPSKKV